MAKKKHEEHENHERWLVSYADFITLLFAFFVVMYSVSSVNEGKYRTVSASIKAALNPINSIPSSRLPFTIGNAKPKMIPTDEVSTDDPVIRRMREILTRINPNLKADVSEVKIVETGHGTIMISLPESILFQSGEARVRSEALPFLKALSEILIEMDRHIRILGHTDNVPIRTAQFPSNWELSAGRAVMVVRIFAELFGVPITHLSATGLADSKPIATNDTPEGRTKNRRVEIIILEKAAQEDTLDSMLPKENTSTPLSP
ncbi:MAG: motB [Nitrospira sp.]|jgi:chemotaxis protein MotB|nr:motB [Nitrospira sp.]MCE3224820.1 motB [Nitrospira sp.]